MPKNCTYLSRILFKAQNGVPLSRRELVLLLELSEPSDIAALFQAARRTRMDFFSDQVFFYGFIYFSTHCLNACTFCQYRRSNTAVDRYRKTKIQIVETAAALAAEGVHLIDLTMGEDPHSYTPEGFSEMLDMIEAVRRTTGLPVMISPGAVSDRMISQLASKGVSWYACYQETHNRNLFNRLRIGQSFEGRIHNKQLAAKAGMLIEEGLLAGVGEVAGDIADAILWMQSNHVDQARVMSFVPQAGTPMSSFPAPDRMLELKTIAAMRIALPDRLIPASLDVDGLDGLKQRLDAGANVVTSIVPPRRGLAGVANHSLDINESRRSLDKVLPVIRDCGLRAARARDYRAWVDRRCRMRRQAAPTERRRVC